MKRRRRKRSKRKAAKRAFARVSGSGWRTTDSDEVARRARRAHEEPMTIRNLDQAEPFFGTF